MAKGGVGVVLACSVIYLLLGLLGLQLAIPPGYSSPVWPAAGVGIAFARRWGAWGVLGSALGHLAVNLTLGSLSVAVLLAAGGAITHYLGGKILATCRSLESPREVAAYALLLPCACTISASLGTGIVWVSGAIGPDQVAANWVSWWIGDSFGALLYAPTCWAWIGDGPTARIRRAPLTLLSLGVTGLGAAAAMGSLGDYERIVIDLLAFSTVMISALLTTGYFAIESRVLVKQREETRGSLERLNQMIREMED